MKKKRFVCFVLAMAMILSVATMLHAFAEATPVSGTDAVEQYGNNKVIFDENYFKTNLESAFLTNTAVVGEETLPAGTVSWNDETGRIRLASTNSNMITDIKAVPADLINYTVQADLYLTEGSSKKFGLGINSTGKWADSTYIQAQNGSKSVYFNNYNAAGSANYVSFDLASAYTAGDKMTVRVTVSDTYAFFTIYYKEVKYTFTTKNQYNAENGIALNDLGDAFGTGSPFFNQHKDAVLEVDNLTVYAGTGIAEPELKPDDSDKPEELQTVYYPDGTVIFSENDLKSDSADMSKLFTTNEGDASKYSITWNTETDRLSISAKSSMVTDITAVPKNLGYYTISADLYLTENNTGESNNAIFGMGINSASTWSRSTYFQYNVKMGTDTTDGSTAYYVNNYDSTGTSSGIKASATNQPEYDVNTTQISLKIQVSDETVMIFLNDRFLGVLKLENLAYELGTGSPWFFQRGNTTIEVDNLLVYAGMTAPDYEKTMANQTPLSAPDIQNTDDSTDDNNNNTGTDDENNNNGTADSSADTSANTGATTTAVSSDTTASDTSDTKSSGCGSVVGTGVVGIVALMGAAVIAGRRKKEDNRY